MRAGCFFVVVTIGLLVSGGQGLYQAVTNRTPTEIACADLDKTLPTKAWVRVTGCRGSLVDASYRSRFGVITEVFVPVRPPAAAGSKEAPAHLVIATTDDAVIDVVKKMSAIDEKDMKGALSFLVENAGKMRLERDFKGVIRSGIDSNDKVLRHLKEKGDVAPQFVVMDEGKEPGILGSLAQLGGGALLAVGMLARAASKANEKA